MVRDLANALAGFDSVRVGLIGTLPHGSALPRDSYHPRVADYCVRTPSMPQPLRRIGIQSGYMTRFSQWLREDNGESSVIHAHLLPGFRLFPVVLRALWAGCPFVQTIHDWPPMEIPYYRQYRLLFRLHWWMAQRLLKRIPVMTVKSAFIRNYASRKWPNHRIQVIPNAVADDSGFLSVPNPPEQDPVRFLFWGELYPKKGPLLLVKAAALLRARHPDLAFRVVLAGGGPDYQRVQAAIEFERLADRVELLGAVSHDHLLRLLAAAHVVTLPSAYEGFGMAILEAMLAGRPVITTGRGGAAEIVCDSRQGVLVDRTPEAFANAMADLAHDPKRRRTIGIRARERAREFSWRSIASQYLEVYASAAARPRLT